MNTDSQLLVGAKRMASLVRHAYLDLYYVIGRYDGVPMRLAVADDGSTLEYMRSLVFPDGSTVKRGGRVPAFAAKLFRDSDADLVVAGVNLNMSSLYVSRGFHLVPRWVRLFLPAHEEPYVRLYEKGRQTRKYFKWMLKKVKDEGFECETVTDPDWLTQFYHDMYKPYAQNRYGDLAVVHSINKVRRAFSTGAGVVAKKEGRAVAASIISFVGTTVRIPHVGVLGGDTDVVRDGAAFAMDYYVAQMAYASGYSYIDFGHSRPFLSDGALKYKMNWHMEVRDDDDAVGLFAVIAPAKTPPALKFLSENAFFEHKDHKIRLCDEYRQDGSDPN